jgi:outer membrane lipase/esterase
VNSALCTTGTIVPGANYATYLFADRVYPTPQGHRKFGAYAYERIRARGGSGGPAKKAPRGAL